MYVRWQRRLRQQLRLEAALVTSRRHQGKPRQQYVAYLAVIAAQHVETPVYQEAFWRRVDRRLETLGLDRMQRQSIERCLTQVVARPSALESRQLDARRHQVAQFMPGG